MIVMYDLEDNYIKEFKNYKECAEYFNTSRKVIVCYICRSKKGIVDKKRDAKNCQWVRLFKVEDQDEF